MGIYHASVNSCGNSFFLCNKFSVLDKISKCSGETVAVVGTLLGALIGGIFTLIGSVYVNKKQLKV